MGNSCLGYYVYHDAAQQLYEASLLGLAQVSNTYLIYY
jgi:hypothetical protein